MGIRVNGLQSASALLLTTLAYMQEDKQQHIDQCAHVFLSFFFYIFLFTISSLYLYIQYLRDRKSQGPDIPVACSLFFSDFQACVAVRDCFIRGIFMGGKRRLSY